MVGIVAGSDVLGLVLSSNLLYQNVTKMKQWTQVQKMFVRVVDVVKKPGKLELPYLIHQFTMFRVLFLHLGADISCPTSP